MSVRVIKDIRSVTGGGGGGGGGAPARESSTY
jgi:hypothetical protein